MIKNALLPHADNQWAKSCVLFSLAARRGKKPNPCRSWTLTFITISRIASIACPSGRLNERVTLCVLLLMHTVYIYKVIRCLYTYFCCRAKYNLKPQLELWGCAVPPSSILMPLILNWNSLTN